MVQSIFNRELGSLGADLTSTDVNKGYMTQSKSKINSMVQDTEEIMCYHCRDQPIMIMKRN